MNSPPSYTLASPDTIPPIPWGYWVVESMFLAGAYPGALAPMEHRQKVRGLMDAGIRMIVNLTEPDEVGMNGRPFVPYAPVVEELTAGWAEGVQCRRFAVPDGGVCELATMEAILDAVDASLSTGRPVYLHCWGGVGRTGTVVGCWLLRHGLANRDTVLDTLDRLRRQDRERGHRPAPENELQRKYVKDWTPMS